MVGRVDGVCGVLQAGKGDEHQTSLTSVMVLQVQLLGQPISVGRPSGYVDPSTAQTAAAAAAAALAAFQVLPCHPFIPELPRASPAPPALNIDLVPMVCRCCREPQPGTAS